MSEQATIPQGLDATQWTQCIAVISSSLLATQQDWSLACHQLWSPSLDPIIRL